MQSPSKPRPSGALTPLLPTHAKSLQNFLLEFSSGTETIHGYFIEMGTPFEEIYETLNHWAKGEALPDGWVPNTTWFWQSAGVIKGVINLRHRLTPALEAFGGHIGYAVAPSHRRQGISTAMLGAVLPHCKAMGIERVLVSCDEKNIGSVRTIEANEGVLHRAEWDEAAQRTSRFYWIELA